MPNRVTNRRNVDEFVVPSSIVQYFLAGIPPWANTSAGGKCLRNRTIRFMDFEKMQKSFSYTHEQLLSFQHRFNLEREKLLENRSPRALGLREEETLFHENSNNIQAGVRSFMIPQYKRIHLVWIDPFVTGTVPIASLKRLFNEDHFNGGHPVFISECLSSSETGLFIREQNFPDAVRILSSEFLTPFGPNFKLSHSLALYIDSIFEGKGKTLVLFTPMATTPESIVGNFASVQQFK